MKRLSILLAISLLFAGCEIFEDYDKEYYYKVEGVGYIINGETNQPFYRGTAFYCAETEGGGKTILGWNVAPLHIDKKFETDENGYFRVKFLKRTQQKDVLSFCHSNLRYKGEKLTMSVVKNAKEIIQLDTIKIFPDTIMFAEKSYNENLERLGQSIGIYANDGIWRIEDGVDWVTFGSFFDPYYYEIWVLPLPTSAVECRSAVITAEYPNGRKDKYIVVQAPREMGNKPNCY